MLTDRNGKPLGLLTGNQKRIFLQSEQIAPGDEAGDHRDRGPPLLHERRHRHPRHRARAVVRTSARSRPSRAARRSRCSSSRTRSPPQDERTLFNKLREAALAYQITRKWSKERILRNYLNTIYFGNGAYGIESAARTYFGSNHPGCGEDGNPHVRPGARARGGRADRRHGRVAERLRPAPQQARRPAKRRALVLQRMVEQGYLTPAQEARRRSTRSLPTRKDIRPPLEDTAYPYFTSWVKQQVVDKLGGGQEGARKAFEGGLTVQTTLDVRLQEAAAAGGRRVAAVQGRARAPRSSRSTTDSGEVLAMVGGDDYATRPFNLATQGQRQPGSSFKPFVLAAGAHRRRLARLDLGVAEDVALRHAQQEGQLHARTFEVNNYEDAYAGVRTLRTATTFSDNSVYAQLGIKVGTRKIAQLARRMGVRTPVSQQLRDDARRPQAGRHPARHGARVPDPRRARAARLQHDEPGRRRPARAAAARPGPGRHPR